jgi:hypothetical protein
MEWVESCDMYMIPQVQQETGGARGRGLGISAEQSKRREGQVFPSLANYRWMDPVGTIETLSPKCFYLYRWLSLPN